MRLAKPEGSDEVEQLPGSGRLLYGSRCHRLRSPLFELDSPERPSGRIHV